MSLALITAMCIAAADVQTINGETVAQQRFEPCPVVEHVKFAPPIKYPSQAECAKNPKTEGCDRG